MPIDQYRLLGRSGLRVSPVCLGTMTFGETWGADEAESRRMFDHYVDLGGNFIDTASIYSAGRSETLVGKFAAKKRDDLVIATKYSLTLRPDNPNAGGNHRKSMMRSVEESLKRLDTDYIDLFYLHVWDSLTPVDEVMRGLDDLVTQGKIVYAGISDTPAWQVSRMQMLADLRGWAPLIALQIEYSLLQRTVERDLIPMAAELGLGVLPWSPLKAGMLSGKHSRKSTADVDTSRAEHMVHLDLLNEETFALVDVVESVAKEMGISAAQVALAWTLANPAVTAPIIGVRTMAQLEDNLRAADVAFNDDQLARLDAASKIKLGFPHDFLRLDFIKHMLFGETVVRPR